MFQAKRSKAAEQALAQDDCCPLRQGGALHSHTGCRLPSMPPTTSDHAEEAGIHTTRVAQAVGCGLVLCRRISIAKARMQ